MWQSEDEFLKDLASLKDFGTPEDQESYKILYSVGRGLKTKAKSNVPEKFIDSRTGEAINIEDESLDTNTFSRSKGRGSLLGSLFRTKLQLQQQLRLARPLGSGDEAVESYYGRNRSTENTDEPVNTLRSESVAQNPKTTSESLSSDLHTSKIIKRVKATRNSNSQMNALINGLLSKQKLDSSTSTNQDFVNDVEDELSHSSSSSSSSSNNDINCKSSDLNDLKFSNLAGSNKWDKKDDTLEKKSFRDDNFKIIDDDEEESISESETRSDDNFLITKNDSGTNADDNDVTESQSYHDEKYRAQDKRPNGLRKNHSNSPTNCYYNAALHSQNSISKDSPIFTDEDFPTLRKS